MTKKNKLASEFTQFHLSKHTNSPNSPYMLMPFRWTMLDNGDYHERNIVYNTDGWYYQMTVRGRRVATDHLMFHNGITRFSEPEKILKFVKKYPFRRNDFARLLPEYVSVDPALQMPVINTVGATTRSTESFIESLNLKKVSREELGKMYTLYSGHDQILDAVDEEVKRRAKLCINK